jgi:hypothetical protein
MLVVYPEGYPAPEDDAGGPTPPPVPAGARTGPARPAATYRPRRASWLPLGPEYDGLRRVLSKAYEARVASGGKS